VNGVLVTFGCIVVGTLLASVDVVAGITVIVFGAVGGLVITWIDLS
jgi:hypothetical protein